MHKESFLSTYRSFDYKGLSRQVTGFRVEKTVAAKSTKDAFSVPVE